MPTSPKSPSTSLSQNPLTIRLYKVLAANFDDDSTKEALDTLSELYAPAPSTTNFVKSKGKEVKREKVEIEDEDDADEEGDATSAKMTNPDADTLHETVPGEIAANARKNLRRDVESKLAESSRRFLTAFAEVDKVCCNYGPTCSRTQRKFSNSIPCKNMLVLCVHDAMMLRHNYMRPMRRADLFSTVQVAYGNKGKTCSTPSLRIRLRPISQARCNYSPEHRLRVSATVYSEPERRRGYHVTRGPREQTFLCSHGQSRAYSG